MNFDIAFDRLSASIKSAIENRSRSAAAIFIAPKNSRAYECSIAGCARPAYAKGMCNAHYIRHRKGADMEVPTRARKRLDECEKCGEKTGAKGGWGLCAKHYKFERYVAVKDAAIAAMGGSCANCGGKFHRVVYDFHHKQNKRFNPSEIVANGSIEAIAYELAKCILLCANCHRLEHSDEL